MPVTRSLESVSRGEDFTLEGMKVSTIVRAAPFRLSSGRPLYTGNRAARLDVILEGTRESRTYELEPFQKYTFSDALSGALSSGRAYVLTPSGTEKLPFSEDMIGMPLLP